MPPNSKCYPRNLHHQFELVLKNIVDSSMNLIPTRYTSTRYSQPWVARECKRISKVKQRAFNRAKRTKQQTEWEYYRSLVKKSRQTCSLAYKQYINDCILPNIKSRQTCSLAYNQYINDCISPNIKSRQTCSLAYNQYINDCISPNIEYNPNPKGFLP